MFRVFYYCLLFYCFSVASQEIERVSVTGSQPYYHKTLKTILGASQVGLHKQVKPASLADILVQDPAVSFNGQGGQLQTINLRGFSRWRIQSLVDGVPIYTERRAGASLEFLPADFVQQIYIVPGAASTYLGSGAIGGGVDVALAEPESALLTAAWGSNQHSRELTYAAGMDKTDWKWSYRLADKGTDAQGRPLLDSFQQNSFFIRHQWQQEKSAWQQAWILYSKGNNVGKSSRDFPHKRRTLYPASDHWLGKLSFNLAGHEGAFYWHQSRVDSHIERLGKRMNQSRSEALNFGLNLGDKFTARQWLFNWRMAVEGRSGVAIYERELTPSQSLVFASQTLDAEQLSTALLFDTSKQFADTALAMGGRFSWQQQHHHTDRINDTNASGFIGFNHSLARHWTNAFYLSSGYRTPSLTERFFHGETPRGRVQGDVALHSEQVLNMQLALSYQGSRLHGKFALFEQQIANYIERQQLGEDLLQYRNLHQAKITGINYRLNGQLTAKLLVSLNGQWLQGEDSDHKPLVDISPAAHKLCLQYQQPSWHSYLALGYRQAKTDHAVGEQSLDALLTLDIGGHWQLARHFSLQAQLSNLTDQLYLTSADDKAPFAHGRELQLKLRYQLP